MLTSRTVVTHWLPSAPPPLGVARQRLLGSACRAAHLLHVALPWWHVVLPCACVLTLAGAAADVMFTCATLQPQRTPGVTWYCCLASTCLTSSTLLRLGCAVAAEWLR